MTLQHRSSLVVFEACYQHALPRAKEANDENQLTHGIVLTNRNDRVLVYQLDKRVRRENGPDATRGKAALPYGQTERRPS